MILKLIGIFCQRRNCFLSKVRFFIRNVAMKLAQIVQLVQFDASFFLSLLNWKINLIARFKFQDNYFCQYLTTFTNWNQLQATFVDFLEILYRIFILEMKTFLCFGKMKFWKLIENFLYKYAFLEPFLITLRNLETLPKM